MNKGEADDIGKAGTILTTISRELGIERRRYLRQIIRYNKSGHEKDNYEINNEYYDLVKRVLEKLTN